MGSRLVITATAVIPTERLALLRQTLVDCFDAEELKTLCFDLGVDYESLPATGAANKARELVSSLHRQHRLGHLLEAAARARPAADWRAILRPPTVRDLARTYLAEIGTFSAKVIRRPLRLYQQEPARAILASVIRGQGLTLAVMMSRQAGKNELSGQLECYLLNLYQRHNRQVVKASPTFKPQTINSIMRLADHLDNPWNKGRWRRKEGYMLELGRARVLFFSAEPTANVVGATADLLLEGDEAQDIGSEKWSKDFVPMGASTNVTRVLWGTAWTNTTLLARTIDALRAQERQDGKHRVFTYNADQVGAEVPAYAAHVAAEVQRLGRQHPLIKTQYFLETIDGEGGLFPPIRRALMRGDHERRVEPVAGHRYALLLDVGGEDEAAGDAVERGMLENKKRDATALTVVDIALTYGQMPTYRVVDRRFWLGTSHASLHAQLLALARHWHAVWVVVDATGVGAGLASFLLKSLGVDRVLPLIFSPKVKSDLGWNFVAVIDTGRYRDYADDQAQETRQFWYEVEHCNYTIHEGPGKSISWGADETPAYDGLIARGHDDLLISAAMVSILDVQEWPGSGPSATVAALDPIAEIDKAEW